VGKSKKPRRTNELGIPLRAGPPTVKLPETPPATAPAPVRPLITKPPLDLDAMSDEDIERVLKAAIFFDPRRCLDEHGNGLPVSMLDDATALALSYFEFEDIWENGERGEPRIKVGSLKKLKASDRRANAETLWKKQGKMGGEDDRHKQRNLLAEYLAAVNEPFVEEKKKK